MSTNIKKVDNNLIIKIPMKARRFNPLDENSHSEMDAIIGVIESDIDMGFCYRIDMDYKNKPDQWTDYFFKWYGDKEEFENLCKQLSIDLVNSCNIQNVS